MNKVFVWESDGDDDEEFELLLVFLLGMCNYIILGGYLKLKIEFEYLVKCECL